MLCERVSSGSPFEEPVGFSRALRDGNTIESTPTKPEGGFVWKGKKTVAVLQVMHAPGREKEISIVSPELMRERTHPKADAKAWDRVFARLTGPLGSTAILVVAGLDKRFEWSAPVPLTVQFVGLAAFVFGMGLMTWAMEVNNYFSLVVRFQTDRGHTVVSRGPYRYVRHPGYVGGITFQLGTPLLLGTPGALIPAGSAVLLIVVRTTLEDRTLLNELEGYREYALQTRYRLLPGLW